jgi:hypothetical protein
MPVSAAAPSPVAPPAPPVPPRVLFLLLDGVAYEHIATLHAAGRFAGLHPPTRVISTYPTLTDPAYDLLFGTGPTPGYEAGYFDRARNRLTPGFRDYVRGTNERWVRHVDYRLSYLADAFMYLAPRRVFARELRCARQLLDAAWHAGRTRLALYILSTDGLGHMLPRAALECELLRIGDWIAAARQAYPDLEIVVLADHGLSTLPADVPYLQRFDLATVLRDAGLRVRTTLRAPGDVVIPVLGLLDTARLYASDADMCARAAAALRHRPEVELVAVRDGAALDVFGGDAHARIDVDDAEPGVDRAGRRYGYRTIAGDPLRLTPAFQRLREHGLLDEDGRAAAADWVVASATAPFPAAPPRLWDGFFVVSGERPDLVLSLNDRWYAGSGLLSRLVRMQGTHGGLHRRVSETFLASTHRSFPGPLDLRGVAAALRATYGWPPAAPAACRAGKLEEAGRGPAGPQAGD